MRKFLVTLIIFCSITSASHSQTMREFHDTFEQCVEIFNSERQHIEIMMNNLHMSSMRASRNGWVAFNIVAEAELRINTNLINLQDKYFFRNNSNNNPESCRQDTQNIVNYVKTETDKVLNMR